MFLLDAEENKKENNSLKEMLDQGFGYLNNLVTEVISKFDESTDMKLSELGKNIVIIYKEIGKILKLNMLNFEKLKNEVVLSNKGNDGNFGNIFKWCENRDNQDCLKPIMLKH
jgi:hypothetical protein